MKLLLSLGILILSCGFSRIGEAAMEIQVERLQGPNGLSTMLFSAAGDPVGRMEAEELRMRPIRLGFFRTNLLQVPTMINVRMEIASTEAFMSAAQMLANLEPGTPVYFDQLELVFPTFKLQAPLAKWRGGTIYILEGRHTSEPQAFPLQAGARIRYSADRVVLLPVGDESPIVLLKSKPPEP